MTLAAVSPLTSPFAATLSRRGTHDLRPQRGCRDHDLVIVRLKGLDRSERWAASDLAAG